MLPFLLQISYWNVIGQFKKELKMAFNIILVIRPRTCAGTRGKETLQLWGNKYTKILLSCNFCSLGSFKDLDTHLLSD